MHFSILLSVLGLGVSSQTNGLGFIYPLDRSIAITGNYGEIRPNHFHAGLDFSTDQRLNLPLKCVADGYVSRIKISRGGYGKVLYVTHANGYVTVYAHQKRFAGKIELYVADQQKELKKNELELFPKPDELIVKQGEIIGYSGNSGSSTGPHLHFEIRTLKSEIPINPLLIYDVKDAVKPVVTHIALYNTQDTNRIHQQVSASVNLSGSVTLPNNTFILNQNTFAIAFSGYDQANGSTNKNNIYEAKLELDGELIYHHQLNYISFDNGRYVNYFSEKAKGVKFQKCFVPSCYDIDIYKTHSNRGRIELKDTLLHHIKLTVTDEKGNSTSIPFKVKARQLTGYSESPGMNVVCSKDFRIKKEDIEYTIKAGSLTKAVQVGAYFNKLGKAVIGNKNDVLLKPFTMSLKVYKPLKGKEDKLIVMNEEDCLLGKYENGWFTTESKSFGVFSLIYDTLPPVIGFPKETKKKVKPAVISFKVADTQSGIGDYNIYLNDVWIIAEYDAKSSSISFDTGGKSGILKIEITDRVGNLAVMKRDL
jgi:hypothetical protein